MKYIKTYENFKSREDWQVGDIVVAVRGLDKINALKYIDELKYRLVKDYKYKIIHIIDNSGYGQTPKNFPICVEDENGQIIMNSKYNRPENFSKDNFITLEEWELKNSVDKYNL